MPTSWRPPLKPRWKSCWSWPRQRMVKTPGGLNIPVEIARREERLRKIAEAKAEIERRAQERYARERGEYDAKMARRAAKEKQTDKKLGGCAPKAPTPGPHDKDQVNFTDEESRIMPVSGGGFEQAYNGQ